MPTARNDRKGMWIYNFDAMDKEEVLTLALVNNVYEVTKTTELVNFLHAAAGFPVINTWVKVIRNNQYATWPGIQNFNQCQLYHKRPYKTTKTKGTINSTPQQPR